MATRSANECSTVNLVLILFPSPQACAFAWRTAHSAAGPPPRPHSSLSTARPAVPYSAPEPLTASSVPTPPPDLTWAPPSSRFTPLIYLPCPLCRPELGSPPLLGFVKFQDPLFPHHTYFQPPTAHPVTRQKSSPPRETELQF